MCPNFSNRRGLGAKRLAKKLCLKTFRLCLPETQVWGDVSLLVQASCFDNIFLEVKQLNPLVSWFVSQSKNVTPLQVGLLLNKYVSKYP